MGCTVLRSGCGCNYGVSCQLLHGTVCSQSPGATCCPCGYCLEAYLSECLPPIFTFYFAFSFPLPCSLFSLCFQSYFLCISRRIQSFQPHFSSRIYKVYDNVEQNYKGCRSKRD
ncbi:hypothetical protein ACOSQ4_028642 [Xanthoceras sorbifolium]